jgi:hypothetical protein
MGRFRIGLFLGMAIGYVLGTRAGRERYEQISRTAKRAWESQTAEKLRSEVVQAMPTMVSSAMHKVGEIRHHNGDRVGAERLPA